MAVLPYRSATQSGISAIACHFEVPMVVTDVGGLKESVGASGTGLVADKPDEESILKEIRRYFSDESLRESFSENIHSEKARLSWKSFTLKLLQFSQSLNGNE